MGLYILILLVLAAATIVEHVWGTDFAHHNIYGAWWFTLLWAVGAAVAICWFIHRRVRRPQVVCLHVSLLIILLGAAITHFTSHSGMLHLRQGKAVKTYTDENNNPQDLPFSIRLEKFSVSYHEGNAAVMDYASLVSVDGAQHSISMNNILSSQGVRLYQSSFDEDMRGSWLRVSTDPVGIPVTYIGYGLLFISLLWMLVDPRGRFRQLLRSNAVRAAAFAAVLLMPALSAHAQHVLPEEQAVQMERLFIVYNGRVCPLETFAIDFTTKLYGSPSYKDFTPTQVLSGVLFWPDEWMNEPLLKIKNDELRDRLGTDSYASAAQFFGAGGYLLGPLLEQAQGKTDKFSTAVLDTDDKLMLLMEMMQLRQLKLFPFPIGKGNISWYGPMEAQPHAMPKAQQQYVRTILPMARSLAQQGNYPMLSDLLQKLRRYQLAYGGSSIPSPTKVQAERIYNRVPFARVLFMLNLTLGLLSFFFISRRRTYRLFTVLMLLSWLVLNVALALRWVISGTIPMGNGYETMLFMAWLVMLTALLTVRRLPVMTTFGLLMSGFMLLVSNISAMDPAITPRMPVLNSPLLTIHVSIIMMAYALLSLTFMASVAFLITNKLQSSASLPTGDGWGGALTTLSELFLYPAIAALGMGTSPYYCRNIIVFLYLQWVSL